MHIHIHGMLHIDNFGDLLLAEATAVWAREAAPSSQVTFPWAAPEVRLALRPYEVRGGDVDAGPNIIIFCGGGYVNDHGGLRQTLKRISRLVLAPRFTSMSSGHSLVLGLGVGPIDTIFGRLVARLLFFRARLLSVRDEESAALVRDLNLTQSEFSVSADMAISYLREKFRNPAHPKCEDRTLVIHITTYGGNIIDALERYLTNYGQRYRRVVAISDQRGSDVPPAVVDLLRKLLGFLPELRPYKGVEETVDCIAATDDVFTTKLHVGVVAATLGRRVFAAPWNYDKVIRFYRQIGHSEACLDPSLVTACQLYEGLVSAFDDESSVLVPEEVVSASASNKIALREALGVAALDV